MILWSSQLQKFGTLLDEDVKFPRENQRAIARQQSIIQNNINTARYAFFSLSYPNFVEDTLLLF